jgi:ubiquinone/menaquinone biosynthesis C-methylase UbiE
MNDFDLGERPGIWGSREAAMEWLRGTTARLQAFGPATERMLDLANIHVGSRVLDIGAGAGDQTLAAARRVGSTGVVLATDISASILEVAATAAQQAGLSNVGTQVMDAQSLDLESDSFDAVISRFALMLIPNIHKALNEIRRVLRYGGRIVAIVFSTPEKCPYLSIPHAITRRVGRLTSPREPFGEFRLAGPGVMASAYENVGFRDVAVEEFPTRRRFPSLAEAMQYAKGPLPLAPHLRLAPDRGREEPAVHRPAARALLRRVHARHLRAPDGGPAPPAGGVYRRARFPRGVGGCTQLVRRYAG